MAPAGPPGRFRVCVLSFVATSALLEGDVVVGRAREVGALRGRSAGHELVSAAAAEVASAAAFAAAEELDAVDDFLNRLALAAAVLRLPDAPFEPSVGCSRTPLRQVLRAALGLFAED